ERTAADGTVQRVTVLLTSAEALGALEVPAVAPPTALGSIGPPIGPSPSGTETGTVAGAPNVGAETFLPARTTPTPRAAADQARPVIRPLSRPAFAVRHPPTWLVWL